MRMIKKSFMIAALSAVFVCIMSLSVRAESKTSLPVVLKTYSNEMIAVLSGQPVYASVPVCFSVEESGDISYSISIDDGENFGGYAPMDKESVTLYPDDTTSPSGRWQIKFRSGSGELVKESAVYNVVFDTVVPQLEFLDDDAVGTILTEDTTVRFRISDDTGISRAVAKCNDETIYEKRFDDTEAVKEYESGITLKDLAGVTGCVSVCAYDLAGNRSEFYFEYGSDREAPQISASGVENDAKLTRDAVLTFTASDKESDVYIDYSIEAETKEETITTEVSNVSSPATVSFTQDGIYRVKAHAVDGAGRTSDTVERIFVIDKNAPVINVDGVTDNVDARSAVGLAIEVDENMYEGSKVDITLIKRVLGKAEMIRMDTYDLQAYKDIRMVNISSDGEYELSARATDSAGNSTSVCRRFRIDSTAPDIALYGLDENEVTRDEPVIRFCAGEMFYDSTVLTALLEKREKNGYVSVRTQNSVMRSPQDHMDITVADEGEYRLTCAAADRSGNSSARSISFTVDRTPPVISGTDLLDNSYLSSFKLPGRLGDLVSDMTKVTAYAYLNDRRIGNDDVIIEEGKYVLTVIAEDEAGNASERSSVFMIDHTAPQIVLSGLDRSGNIRKGSVIKVSLFDEGDRLTSVRFNERDIAIDKDNTATIPVDEYGNYRICVCAADDAGNVTDTEIHTSCEMYAPSFMNDILTEKSVSVSQQADDIDVKGILIGLMTALSGTVGLALRSRLKS